MQVQSLRLANDWRHRTVDNTELTDQRTETFARIHAALEERHLQVLWQRVIAIIPSNARLHRSRRRRA
jgi:hypothetical protein